MADYKYLIMVDPVSNHNKFYEMKHKDGCSTFEVTYGRVGASGVTREYSMDDWYKKYDEKIRKGYTDQTSLHQTPTPTVQVDDGYAPIKNAKVEAFINELKSYTDRYIRKHYTIKVSAVTQEMIDSAQLYVGYLYTANSVESFNRYLKNIFEILPRRMGDVFDYLAKSEKNFDRIIEREEKVLSVMRGKVNSNVLKHSSSGSSDGKQTYLDAHGLDVRPATASEKKQVLSHLDSSVQKRVKSIFRAVNSDTDEAFNTRLEKMEDKTVKFLCHGTRNPNVLSIMDVGLKIHPPIKVTKAGHMWGYGEYFGNNNAEGSIKAMGYCSFGFWNRHLGGKTSDKGYLLIFKVATGKAYHCSQWSPRMSELDYDKVHKMGYDSLHVHGGNSVQHDELIVYREDQMTLRYVVELG